MQRVALLGLGTMGAGMAANWLAKGFPLSVWNRTPAKAQALAAQGRQSRGDAARSGGGRRLHLRHGGGRRGLALGLARGRRRAGRNKTRRGHRRIEHADARLGARARRSMLAPRDAASSTRRSAAAVRRRRPASSGSLSAATLRRWTGRGPRSSRSRARLTCSDRRARARPGNSSTTSSSPLRSPRSPRRSTWRGRRVSGRCRSPVSSSTAPR